MEPTSTLETLKEKILPFTEYPTQYLRTIETPDGALKDTYLCYLEV